ncbi:hypothetical protein MOQ72_43315 [Saccharopolyspora sp. K220]|uniref:hypothetical protein n=1 Tax=Saccharopolyspora soli TaxID=2926618 RepID=UPI001F5AB2ED|nr:hypothetical protein [Saccharopolyspora soli]MCI2424244.1 hypothetical protein [Saccharopolyspora soli]
MTYQGWPSRPLPPQYPAGPGQKSPKKSYVWIPVLIAGLALSLIVATGMWVLLARSGPSGSRDRADVVVPPIPTADTNLCALVDQLASDCAEWARPEPRSFRDVLRLDGQPQQPPATRWSPLYLCAYPPDELIDQFMGPDFRRVVINGFICSYESPNPDMRISFDVYVGSGTFESWTDISPEAEVVDFHGRRVIVDHDVEEPYSAFRSWIMEIPGGGNNVLVLDYKGMAGIGDLGSIPADQAKADQAMTALGEIYRKVSE